MVCNFAPSFVVCCMCLAFYCMIHVHHMKDTGFHIICILRSEALATIGDLLIRQFSL